MQLPQSFTIALAGSCLLPAWSAKAAEASGPEAVPGVVIDYRPAASDRYLGSPSLVILPDGNYLASHDFFGPQSGCQQSGVTAIFCSTNRGASWTKTAELPDVFWSNLFVHDRAAYLLGTTCEYGSIAIHRSRDDGHTWTTADSPATGRLTARGHWHTAPVPVVVAAGRLWRAFENADHGQQWGRRFCAGMVSAPVNCDLLDATNWTFSNFLPGDPQWLAGGWGGWLEGNAVVTPGGQVVDLLRCDVPAPPERAALVKISADGQTATFDPATDFIDFPGGAKKFTVRYDSPSQRYWTLVNNFPATERGNQPGAIRNTLSLASSPDLVHWQTGRELLHHARPEKFGFQYADWQFDGQDIVAVVRSAFDDATGGAPNYHDANYEIFLRVPHFRGPPGGY